MLVPHANVTLRRVPEGMSDDVALFAGDVMGTGWHAVDQAGVRPGDTTAVLGLGPVGLCAVQAARAAGAARVIAIDSVEQRLELARSFGAEPVHLTEDDPRAAVKAATDGRGVDAAIDAVGHPDALDLACRVTRKAGTVSATGVYAERIELHMGIVWIKALTLRTGQANVIGHVDRVLAMLEARRDRSEPARHAPHAAGGRGRGVRGLRPPRGPQDRDDAMSVERGTAAQLVRRREQLAQGAEPIGWKIGFNLPAIQEQLGIDAPAGRLPHHRRPARRRRDLVARRRRGARGVRDGGRDGRGRAARSRPCCPRSSWPIRPDLDDRARDRSWPATSFTAAVAFGPRVETDRPGAARMLVNGEEQHEIDAERAGAALEAMVAAASDAARGGG